MTLTSYEYKDISQNGWKFDKFKLGKLNLFVGASGSGKTRLLNTMFNLALIAVGKELQGPGKWDVEIEQKGTVYNWIIVVNRLDAEKQIITKEKIVLIKDDESKIIVDRDENKFIFNENELPKLPKDKTSISLLKDEELINPLIEAFNKVLKRYFSIDTVGKVVEYGSLHEKSIEKLKLAKNDSELFGGPLDLSSKLWIIKELYPDKFKIISDYFISVFPFIKRVDIKDLRNLDPGGFFPGLTPAFCIKEYHVSDWIFLHDLSTGMQKILLLLVDICTMPRGGTYLIDEYENSLGINAIDFFPDFINEIETEAQIILTSHHPYLINNIDPENWFVLHRKGSEVKIKYGSELKKKLGKSKQQYFVQLINDPFYSEGIG